MTIDAHQHFWLLARGDYGWLKPDLGAIHRDIGPDDLEPLLRAQGVEGTVLVQAAPTEAETEYLLDIAADTPFVLGVVGWFDMASREAPARLARLRQYHGGEKLVGMRPMIQDIPDDDWMLRPTLTDAFHALCDQDLAFDALVLPRHLCRLRLLAKRYPDLRIVLDHAGKPDIAHWRPGGEAFRQWRHDLEMLADLGISCKLSGLVTEARAGWQHIDLEPYIAAVLEVFGAEGVMWGSDWPVLEIAGNYREWHSLVRGAVARLAPDALAAVFEDNARNFYGLRVPMPA